MGLGDRKNPSALLISENLLRYVEPLSDARTKLANFFNNLLVRGAGWFWAEPGCVLEDAPRAGVVDELLTTDETLLHRHLAPGAEAIGEVG